MTTTHFSEQCDVLVAGAGVAGIAAALESARAGFKTILVEKTILPGGLATSGLIYIYLPLCDGNGHQVVFGIAEELLQLSIRFGPGDIPAGWRSVVNGIEERRYRTPFSPAAFVLALDEVLEQAGVILMYDTLVCQAVVEAGRITGLEVENKSGRGLLRASCVIDATGDADVAYRAGATCADGDNWLSLCAIQNSHRSNPDANADKPTPFPLNVLALGSNPYGDGQPAGMPKYSGTDHQQVTRFVLEGRRLLRQYYQAHQAGETGRQDLFPVCLPSQAQFRTTRRIVGRTTLTEGQQGIFFADSIGLAPDWRKAGPIWEIPLNTLIPVGVEGLVAAGRCISSAGDAWEVTRVIPVAALTGQAAGIVARLAVQHHILPHQVSAGMVQQELSRQGIPYHISDLTSNPALINTSCNPG